MNEPLPRSKKEITELYLRNADVVYRVCFMFLKNASDAEDAMQSVFMKLIQAAPAFADPEHEKAWLIVTAQNHCKNALRYWWKRKRSSLDQLPELTSEEKPLSGELMESLLELPDKYKTVLYLFYYEGYSTGDIARMLGLNESTVRTRLSSGRKRLKLSLTGGQDHEEKTVNQYL